MEPSLPRRLVENTGCRRCHVEGRHKTDHGHVHVDIGSINRLKEKNPKSSEQTEAQREVEREETDRRTHAHTQTHAHRRTRSQANSRKPPVTRPPSRCQRQWRWVSACQGRKCQCSLPEDWSQLFCNPCRSSGAGSTQRNLPSASHAAFTTGEKQGRCEQSKEE